MKKVDFMSSNSLQMTLSFSKNSITDKIVTNRILVLNSR